MWRVRFDDGSLGDGTKWFYFYFVSSIVEDVKDMKVKCRFDKGAFEKETD